MTGRMRTMRFVPVAATLCALISLPACREEAGFAPLSRADSTAILSENLRYRSDRQEFFRTDPASPFNRDSTAGRPEFQWFPVDPLFRGYSILHRHEKPVTVEIAGTGGEIRKQLRYGYFEFPVPDTSRQPVTIRLNVYKSADPQQHPGILSVWFTDLTTGVETYGVGRYVDVEPEHEDPDHRYVIDLNMAYNPFCAYSDLYSCAIPSKDDFVPVFIRAGEQSYHE